jgi:hypothetical protein
MTENYFPIFPPQRDDFLGFNPHLHILFSDCCFYGEGPAKAGFRVAPRFETKQLEEIFRHNVFPSMRETTFQRQNHSGSGQFRFSGRDIILLKKLDKGIRCMLACHTKKEARCGKKHAQMTQWGVPQSKVKSLIVVILSDSVVL